MEFCSQSTFGCITVDRLEIFKAFDRLNWFFWMTLFTFQAKEDYEREQRRKERRKETGESTWMLPSLSKRLTEEADSEEKVD